MADPKQMLYSPVPIDDADFVDFAQIDPKMEEENAEFEAFKSQMHDAQDDAKITVSKKLTDSQGQPLGRKSFQCFSCGIDDYDFSQICTRIREEFGTGLYKIQGRDSNGKFKFGKTVGILAPNIPGQDNKTESFGALVDKVSDAMARQQDRTESMMKDLMGPRTGGDAIEQIVKIAGAVAPILTALGISRPDPAPAPKTLVEQLTEFKMIKELFGSEENGGGMGGEANLYSLMTETVKAFGGPIAQAIAAGAESGELTQTGVAALPAPDTSVQPTEKIMSDQEKHNFVMRKNIHILIQNAKAEVPPETFATVLVNNTPEDKADELFDFISAEDCVATIIKIEPAAAAYKEWFAELREAVIELMTEPEIGGIEPEIGGISDDNDAPGQELQADNNGSKLPGSETVAGEDLEAPSSDDKSDSDPPGDT